MTFMLQLRAGFRRHLGFLALVYRLIQFKGAAASRPRAISLAPSVALALLCNEFVESQGRVNEKRE